MTFKKPSKTKRAVSESDEQSFNLMFERHAATMLLIEPQTGAILDANQAAVNFYGYSKAELCEMFIQEINMLPSEQVAAERQKAFSEERNYFVFPHRLASGEERIVEVRSSPVDWKGKQVLFSIIHDITDNKRTEKALRESEAMLQKVQEVTHMGSWVIDLNTKTVVASDEAHRIYGIAQGSMTLDYVQSVPLPEFRPILDAALTALIREGNRYDVEFKIKRQSDGEIRDVHSIAEYNASSWTIIGSVQDITERKQAEEALKKSEIWFKSLFEKASDGIFYLSMDNDLVEVNDSFARMHGYSVEEMRKMKLSDLDTPKTTRYFSERMRRIMAGEVFTFEVEHFHKDGHAFPLEVTTSMITVGDDRYILAFHREITERKLAEEALRASEALYRQAIEVAGAVPYLQSYTGRDMELHYDFIGEGIRKITGYGPEEFNVDLWDSLTQERSVLEDLAGYSFDEAIERVRSGISPVWKCEHHIRARDGSMHWIFEAAVELRDENGVSHGSIGTFQDITERKQAEAALRESEALYQKAIEVANAVPYHQAYHVNSKTVDYAFIGEGIRQITGYGPEEFDEEKWDSLIQESVLLDDLAGYSWLEAIERVRSGISPVWRCNHRIRARDGSMHWVFEAAVELRDENGVSHGSIGMFQDITERKQAEESLRESEEKMSSIFRVAPTGIGVVRDRILVEVNPRISEMTGYTKEELTGQSARILYPTQEEFEWVGKEKYTQIAEKGSGVVETRWQKKDGFIIDVLLASIPIDLADLSKGVTFTALDITARKQAEEALATSEAKLRALVEQVPAIVYTELAEARETLYISPQVEKLTGYTPAEWIRDRYFWKKMVHPDDLAVVVDEDERTSITHEPFYIDYRILTRDGRTLWVHDESVLIQNQDGTPLFWQGLMHDITERKQAEEALRESEERFHTLYDNATIGLYRTTPDGRILMSNSAGIRMLGFDSFDEITKRNLENVGFGPEYSRKEFREKLETEGVVIGLESKWIRKDGSEIFVRENAKVFRDENGKALYYDGSFEDITERKRTEDQLRKLSRAVEQNPASIVITDLLGNIEYVNPRFSQVTGYSFEESLGQNPRILKSGNTTEEEYKNMWDTILSGSVWQGEFLNKTKNGEIYWEFATITPVFGEDGKITNFLALKENITERKQAEENLERANLDLSLAYDATIEGWSRAMDLRDHETEGHTLRVTELTMKLARAMRISESQLTAIRRGALLHDIGKIGVPDAILLKEGKLTDEEWALMRKHPQLAQDMLAPISYLNDAVNIPYCHHEKWDGTGYPQGLKGDRIPLIARIFAVVDVWDALTNDRTYRRRWSREETLKYIKEQSNIHFDPQVVDVFLKHIKIDSE